jgi:DNA-binding NarL/FixJ family response regulator
MTETAERPARILIVEDDYLIALELEHRLNEAGFRVVGVAESADKAVALGRSERPEVVVMDIRLVGQRDGIDAAVELLRQYSIPSIFASAHADEATLKRAETAQPLGWLQKPYSTTALVELLNRVLSTKH